MVQQGGIAAALCAIDTALPQQPEALDTPTSPASGGGLSLPSPQAGSSSPSSAALSAPWTPVLHNACRLFGFAAVLGSEKATLVSSECPKVLPAHWQAQAPSHHSS